MPPYLTRPQSIEWFVTNRQIAIEKIKTQGAGKVKIKCPLCEAMGEFTILPDFDGSEKKYKVTYFCAECGFRIDDEGLKYFPPPPPPEHLRHRKK